MDQHGNGDCGYRSIAQARYFLQHGKNLEQTACKREAAWLRAQAVQHVKNHTTEFHEFLVKDKDVSPEAAAEDNAVAQWLETAADTKTWIDGLAIYTLACKLGVPIVVWKTDKEKIKRYTLAPAFRKGFAVGAQNCKPIALCLQDGHYTHLAPPEVDHKFPKEWLKECDLPQTQELHGAGKQSVRTPSLHGVVSFQSSLKPTTCHKSQARTPSLHTLVSSKDQRKKTALKGSLALRIPNRSAKAAASLMGAKHAGKKTQAWSVATQDELLGLQEDMDVNGKDASHTPVPVKTQTWKCPVCSVEKKGTWKQICTLHRWHCKSKHPDVPYSQFLIKPRNVPPVIPSNQLPVSERAWQCPFCDVGLPKL